MKKGKINISLARSNLEKVFAKADDIDFEEGKQAYFNYNRTLNGIARATDLPLDRVAGCFSALSPNNDYMGNLRSCVTLCLGFSHGAKEENCTVTTYNANRAKAWRLLQGQHFYSVYKGLKVRNFYRNLTEPNHPEAVTIDGHMFNVCRNELTTLWLSGLSKTTYAALAKVFHKVANAHNLLPSQLQAIVWFVWKRIHNIKFNGQLNFFESGNAWQNFVKFENIKPFTIKLI